MAIHFLVEPEWPMPTKSKNFASKGENHHKWTPIGLLKIGAMLEDQGHIIRLIKGTIEPTLFDSQIPDEIWITTLFTYYEEYVMEAVRHYHHSYSKAKINIGGIATTLQPDRYKRLLREIGLPKEQYQVYVGIFPEAEKYKPAYHLLGDYSTNILHGQRGCIRKCKFCGNWKLESFSYKTAEEIISEIDRNMVVFYDNNSLANPNFLRFLKLVKDYKVNGKYIKFESQSGFDARLLTHELAAALKKARFINPRIAWDNGVEDRKVIERSIEMLERAGYRRKDIQVFMLYNWIYPFEVMELKRKQCMGWGVKVADCRFRPLDSYYDNYNPRAEQSSEDYYIHEGWDDKLIKQFRKHCRGQNILINRALPKDTPTHTIMYYKNKFSLADQVIKDYGFINYKKQLTA